MTSAAPHSQTPRETPAPAPVETPSTPSPTEIPPVSPESVPTPLPDVLPAPGPDTLPTPDTKPNPDTTEAPRAQRELIRNRTAGGAVDIDSHASAIETRALIDATSFRRWKMELRSQPGS